MQESNKIKSNVPKSHDVSLKTSISIFSDQPFDWISESGLLSKGIELFNKEYLNNTPIQYEYHFLSK
jgi:hypothetical protein